jgi:exodeoxyribonuclease VII large subunit
LYFSLKDAHSELRCVMWRSTAARLKFTPEAGLAVIATGGIEVYAPRGTYQLMVRKLEPRGVGALELAFRQLKARLEKEGLFDPDRKKPLPHIPQRVALVTSPSGAAIRDILHTFHRRYPALEILVFPVRVQGEGAAQEIADAIGSLNRHAAKLGGIDLAIVGRGGGSLEDLWAFNEEVVARAIAASTVPVVSAVGHEVDITISDLVADLRAPTPTAAAELITPRMADLVDELAQHIQRLGRAMGHAIELARATLATTLAYDGLARPLARIDERRQLIDELHQGLQRATQDAYRCWRDQLQSADHALLRFRSGARFAEAGRSVDRRLYRLLQAIDKRTLLAEQELSARLTRLARAEPTPRLRRYAERCGNQKQRLANAVQKVWDRQSGQLDAQLRALAACDPKRVLQRGYSITRDARTRKVIRSLEQIRDQMRIVTEVADGEFRGTAEDPRQPNLFD